MIRTIVGFHQDDAGDWVAELSCLHGQHVRHRPPFLERPWVLEEEGRAGRIGAPIACPLCDRAELPEGLVRLRTAGPWDETAIPPGLRRAHRTAEGVWARVCVRRGSARLHVMLEPPLEVTLGAGAAQPVPPGAEHDVVVDGPVQLEVEFWGSAGVTRARVPPVYDTIGRGYASRRVADGRIHAAIVEALGDARLVLDVGAGAGSYEPAGRDLVALDASTTMLAQRAPGAAPAVVGMAERLPFADRSFDAVMAVLTVHHWEDRRAGYAELRRVAPRRVVLTYEPAVHNRLWVVADYLPEIAELDARRPGFSVDEVAAGIGADRVLEVPVPHDCADGFIMAFWRRPEAYLDPAMRAATSGFSSVDQTAVQLAMARLRDDLASGAWDARYGALRGRDELDAGLRLVVASG